LSIMYKSRRRRRSSSSRSIFPLVFGKIDTVCAF